VKSGEETKVVLERTGHANYRSELESELKVIRESEMWQAGAQVRSLRPDNK
jgi:ketol-acid reductoisomerase